MGKMDASMQIVAICQEFGWTYGEYLQQPTWFLTLIREKLTRDQKDQERRLKSMKRGQ